MLIGAAAPRPAPPRRRLASPLRGRGRALLCLTAVVALATGTGVQSTLAAFTDSAPVTGTSISTGTIDFTVNDTLAGAANIDGTWQFPGMGLATAAPGEADAVHLRVKNAGTLPLVYDVSGTATGSLAATSGMGYYVAVSSTLSDIAASKSGTAGNNDRAVSCGPTSVTDTNTTVLTSTATTFVSNRSLAVGATDYLCIANRLNSSAGNSLQGATSVATIKFSARQVG